MSFESNQTISLLSFWFYYGLRLSEKYCVVPENIHTSPGTEGIFSKTPHPSGNSSKAFDTSLNFWILQNPPPPRKFQSPLWGEYGYFLDVHIKQLVWFWFYNTQCKTTLISHPKLDLNPLHLNFEYANKQAPFC